MVVGDFAQGTQVAVVGGGPGGYVAAIRAAQLGLEVVLIEKEHLGGVCLNWGCIPSKALIYASGLKAQIQDASRMGIMAGDATIDLPRLNQWKGGIVQRLRKGVTSLLSQYKVEVVTGTAQLTGDSTLVVQGNDMRRRYEYQNLILATGSRPVELQGVSRDGEIIIDSKDAVVPKSVPERFVVIGAGAVGLEMGIVYAKLGSMVTMIDLVDRLLPTVDSQIARVMEGALKKLNITLILGAAVQGVVRKDSGVELHVRDANGERSIAAQQVLVAIGRRPNTDGIGLEDQQVRLDPRGYVIVNHRMQTSFRGIYAIGDMVTGPMLAHKASYQGKVAAEVIAGEPAAFDGVQVPNVIFSDPEIATVGIGEEEARKKGINVKTGVFPFKALGRALTMNEDGNGFTKVISDAESGTVLGVHIVGPHASDLISEGCLAVASASHVDDLILTMHPHPTLPESILEAAEQVENHAIHLFNPPATRGKS